MRMLLPCGGTRQHVEHDDQDSGSDSEEMSVGDQLEAIAARLEAETAIAVASLRRQAARLRSEKHTREPGEPRSSSRSFEK
jgi:hypothetical protein